MSNREELAVFTKTDLDTIHEALLATLTKPTASTLIKVEEALELVEAFAVDESYIVLNAWRT